MGVRVEGEGGGLRVRTQVGVSVRVVRERVVRVRAMRVRVMRVRVMR